MQTLCWGVASAAASHELPQTDRPCRLSRHGRRRTDSNRRPNGRSESPEKRRQCLSTPGTLESSWLGNVTIVWCRRGPRQ